MKEAVMYARYSQAGNKTIYGLLSKLSNDEREKSRGSYFGSLSGLFRHIVEATVYFLGMYKSALGSNAAASKALSALESLPPMPEEGPLSEAQWKALASLTDTIDGAYVAMAEELGLADLELPVQIEWYGGNPAQVPLSFMLSQLLVHNTHHRGQISQILDELKIDNNYSGINVEFLPK